MNYLKLILKLSLLLILAQSSYAENLDQKAQELLISKLTNVYLSLPNQDPSKLGITLRLADLHSEKARVAYNEELGRGCTDCKAGREDRLKALQYYKEALPKVSADTSGRVMTQIGHIYQMLGNEKGAIDTYNGIIQSNKEGAGEAHLALAEIYFKKNQFALAKSHYEAVMGTQTRIAKGLAAYRIAWCDYHAGKISTAVQMMEKILTTPTLLTRAPSADVVSVDQQFHEEVSRDFVTFIAHKGASVADANNVFKLSPESTKLNNIFALATELERLGQKGSSIEVYKFLQEKENRPLYRLEGQVRLAQLEMESKQTKSALENYVRSLTLWGQVCGKTEGSQCNELRVRLKNFVVDLHKLEKANPSEELLSAYENFLKIFPQDTDMNLQAALVAKTRKEWPISQKYFATAALLLKQQSKTEEKLEATLLNEIEMAELSKDQSLLDKAWERYISNTVKKSRLVDVQYQKTKLKYDKKNYEQAAQEFYEIAVSNTPGSKDVKEKAADLALDALVLLKDDTRLEAWASEFSKKFPTLAREFNTIANTSRLNQAAGQSKDSPDSALEALSRVEVSSLTLENQVTYYRNQILLAEKSKKFTLARQAVEKFMQLQKLTEEDREFGLSHRAYLAELVLDFSTALYAHKESKKAENNKLLKLALFAELAHLDARPYYLQYLQTTSNQDQKLTIAAKLIKESKDPTKELLNYRPILRGNPTLLSQLYLETYSEDTNPNLIKEIAKEEGLKATFGYKTLLRLGILDEYVKLTPQITKHQITTQNDRKMAADIKARGAMLVKLEAVAKRSVDLADYTSQLIVLSALAQENKRFYEEVLSLPMPAGLTPEEQNQYLQLLSQQVAPHQQRSQELNTKLSELWGNSKALEDLKTVYPEQKPSVLKLLAQEVDLLAQVAPESHKSWISKLTNHSPESKEKLDLKTLEVARNELRQDPLSISKLEGLIRVEKKLQNTAMVGYLESRLQNLKDGKE